LFLFLQEYEMSTESSLEKLAQETQYIWDQNAEHWDSRMGEGNAFQRVLIGPACERLLNLKEGQTVLELACGNGVFARRMAQLGAHVVATDVSARLLELAKARSTEYRDRIEYHQVDATKEEQILAFGKQRFDAAVCNMGIMDIPEIDPLMRAVRQALKPQGRFVFAIMHPCFNSSSVMGMEMLDQDQEPVAQYYVKIAKYLHMTPFKGTGMSGQPLLQYYFHRPLHVLFSSAFRAGFVIDGLEEPAFNEKSDNPGVSWRNYNEIPPVLVARLRPLV
jgi:ubiquinone/menaquinone biosynthesis C-methylase UbiE